MLVERWRRRRAEDRRPPGPRLLAVVALSAVISAASCAAVEDAIDSADSEAATEATTITTALVFDPVAYCALRHEADQLNASFTEFNDAAALEGFTGELVSILAEATPPPEIEAEFALFRRAYVDLQAQLAANGFDAAVLSSSPILSDANVNAAIDAIDQYDDALCGPAPGVEPPEIDNGEIAAGDNTGSDNTGSNDIFAEAIASGDFTAMEEILRTELGRQSFIEGFTQTSPGITDEQAGCFLDNTDIAALAEMSVDPGTLSDESVSAFLASLETCNIPLAAFQTD